MRTWMKTAAGCLAAAGLSLTLAPRFWPAAQVPAGRQPVVVNHRSILTFDALVDTPMRMPSFDIGKRHPLGIGQVDLPRMEDGGLAAVVFAVFREQGKLTDAGRAQAIQFAEGKIAEVKRAVQSNAGICRLATSADEIEAAFRDGKKAVMLGMENGYQIGLDVRNLDRYFQHGVRVLTLVHNSDNDICDSSTDGEHPDDRGLSEFGRRVVGRMNQLGMVIDLAHVSDRTFFDVIRLSRAPVIVSHGAGRGMTRKPRNVSDEQLRALRANGGVVGIALGAGFFDRVTVEEHEREIQAANARVAAKGGFQALSPEEAAAHQKEMREIKYRYPQAWGSVRDVVDHIDHVVHTIGIDHVGIGSDFDGGAYLGDCRDVSEFPNLTTELLRRGYSETDIRKIWGGNFLRVLRSIQGRRGSDRDKFNKARLLA